MTQLTVRCPSDPGPEFGLLILAGLETAAIREPSPPFDLDDGNDAGKRSCRASDGRDSPLYLIRVRRNLLYGPTGRESLARNSGRSRSQSVRLSRISPARPQRQPLLSRKVVVTMMRIRRSDRDDDRPRRTTSQGSSL